MTVTTRVGLAGMLALAAACSSDPTDPSAGNRGDIQLSFSQLDQASALSAVEIAGNVSLEAVQSIDVTITEIRALRVDAGGVDAGWVTIDLGGPVELDLMALPTTAEGAVSLNGSLEVGTYRNLRLIVSEASITFNTEVTIGGGPAAVTYEAGTAHELEIAGPPESRLILPTTSFVVSAESDANADVIFDAGTSVQSIVATPLFLMIAPVLIAQVDAEA